MGVWTYDFVEVQTHDGPQAPVHDVGRRVHSLSSVGKSHDPMPHRPRSKDRTQSPVAVSQKREYFKLPPETIGIFAVNRRQRMTLLREVGQWFSAPIGVGTLRRATRVEPFSGLRLRGQPDRPAHGSPQAGPASVSPAGPANRRSGSDQFDYGRVPGWKTGHVGRIFREWKQSSNAIAALSTNVPKQSS